MRAQFNGLKDLIDALQTITGAVVDGVNTLPAGDPAAVDPAWWMVCCTSASTSPEGVDGSNGTPFAAAVDEVNTLPSGEPATVESSFDGSTVHRLRHSGRRGRRYWRGRPAVCQRGGGCGEHAARR